METARDPAIAAVGYLELGMYDDAWDELESLSGDERSSQLAVHTRFAIIHVTGQWEAGRVSIEAIVARCPEHLDPWIFLAHCVRRSRSVADAREVLRQALRFHPESAPILYDLSCHSCQLGELGEARRLLARAVLIEPDMAAMAAAEPDLAPILGTGAAAD